MKKTFLAILLVFIIVLSTAEIAVAQKNKININGVVTAINDNILTVATKKGITYDVVILAEIDLSEIEIGDSVLIKASPGEDGSWVADVMKELGAGNDEEDEFEIDDLEGFQDHSAYCSDDKKTEPHPLAPMIAERYGVSEEFVMNYYCEGYSIGAIMLALRTSQLNGITADPSNLLLGRASGNGWGQIWKELGLIGSEKEGHSPPGQLKKQENSEP